MNGLPHLICLLIGIVKFLFQSDAHVHLGHMPNPLGWVPAVPKNASSGHWTESG